MNREQRRASERAGRRKAKKAAQVALTGAAVTAGFGVVSASPAAAATFNVTNLNDSGAGSLRQAIIDANGAAGADTITFQAGLTGTITLTTGQLDINDSVTITGPGAAALSVSGNDASRVFYLYDNGSTLDVTISGLTVTDGDESYGGGIVNWGENLTLTNLVLDDNNSTAQGGGLASENGNVTLTNVTVSGNTAATEGGGVYFYSDGDGSLEITSSVVTGNDSGGDGGGVYFYGYDSTLAVTDSTLTSNDAGGDGGGLFADGWGTTSFSITNSVITGNDAQDGGGVYIEDTGSGGLTIQGSNVSGNTATGNGGGVYLYDPDSDMLISQTTISGNTATDGGGIYFYSADGGTFTIEESTISGNTASDDGGGVYFYGVDYPLFILSSTISGNTASDNGGGVYLDNAPTDEFYISYSTIAGNTAGGAGGGVYLYDTDTAWVTSSIVANNSASADADLAGGGDFDLLFSLVESPGGANIVDSGDNILSQDPQLGALANNGGPTQTHLPASTSPVVDAGDPAFVAPPSTDQRGLNRVNGVIDIGSVEVTEGTVQFAVTAVTVNENGVNATLSATRTGGTDGVATVDFVTEPDTAQAPLDYSTVTGTLTWASGDGANKSFNVPIVWDSVAEGNEAFNAYLYNETGAVLGANDLAVVTIVNVAQPTTTSAPLAFTGSRDSTRTLAGFGGLFAAAGAALMAAGGRIRRRRSDS